MERFWEDTWPSRPFAKDPPHPSDMRQPTPLPHHPLLSVRTPPPRTPEEGLRNPAQSCSSLRLVGTQPL